MHTNPMKVNYRRPKKYTKCKKHTLNETTYTSKYRSHFLYPRLLLSDLALRDYTTSKTKTYFN